MENQASRKNHSRTLRIKIPIIVFVTVSLLFILGRYLQYKSSMEEMDKKVMAHGEAVAHRIAMILGEPVSSSDIKAVRNILRTNLDSDPSLIAIRVWDAEKTASLVWYCIHGEGEENCAPLQEPEHIKTNSSVLYKAAQVGEVELEFTTSIAQNEIRRDLANSFILLLALNAALILLLIILLQYYVLHPIKSLYQAIRYVQDGRLDMRVSISSQDEIGDLADEFNMMLAEVRLRSEESRLAIENSLESARQITEVKNQLSAVIHSLNEAVIAINPGGRIILMNGEARKLTDWNESQGSLPFLADVIKFSSCDGILIGDLFAKITNSIPPFDKNCRLNLLTKDGRSTIVSVNKASMQDSQGHAIGVVLVLQDISEQVALEEQTQHEGKIMVIGQLATGVAHDFNNLLGGMMGAAQLISSELPKESSLHTYVHMILESADKAADLIRTLLIFSRKGKVQATPVNINQVIKETEKILIHTLPKNIEVEKDLDPDNPMAMGDPKQIQNSLLNLIINARDAMPLGGKIRISTAIVTLNEAFCKSIPFKIFPGKYLETTIADTGIGIEKEDLPHIFEPFFTTKREGKSMGLGLPAVYRTAKNHGGIIQVVSEAGVGSCFKLYLPLLPAEIKTSPVLMQDMAPASGTILLIEDEYVVRETNRLMLEKLGYTVEVAEDGNSGLARYNKHTPFFDLVMLDMIMPHMGGVQAFEAIRKINPKARVLLSSGFGFSEDVQKLLNAGAVGFIQKPCRLSVLNETVAKVIHSHSE